MTDMFNRLVCVFVGTMVIDCLCFFLAVDLSGPQRDKYGWKIVFIPYSGIWCLYQLAQKEMR